MKSTPTPYTHTGVTTEEIQTTVGPSSYSVTVPAGTRCTLLEGPGACWVVDDLQFIEDKAGILYHDADHYGIRIQQDKVTDIQAARR